MKRSEAVSEIHEYIFQNYYDLQATDLLEIMEALGMLPPFFPPEKLSVMQDEKKYTQYYRWEPEDE